MSPKQKNIRSVLGNKLAGLFSAASARASRLYLRILLINLIVLLIPVISFLYSDQYRKGFIKAELAAIQAEGQLIATALSVGAVRPNEYGINELDIQISQQWLQIFSKRADSRIRLFTPDGELQLDSIRQGKSAQSIQIEKIAMTNAQKKPSFLSWLFDLGSWRQQLDLYVEHPIQQAEDYKEVNIALNGNIAHAQRVDDTGDLILSIALPIKRLRRVQGAILLSRDNTTIETQVNKIRSDTLRYSLWALLITILLSFYIAWTIARPVRLLALVADKIRTAKPYQVKLPDYSKRRDEIGDLSLSLTEMTEALWARLDAIERFAADVSHEIKNPLTSLRSAVETASMIKDPEKFKRLIAIIVQDVNRLDRLISDISDASRLDAELSRADIQTVDVIEMLTALCESHNLTKGEEQSELVLKAQGEPQLVYGLEGRLGQVIRNLVSNALSFTPPDKQLTLRTKLGKDNWIDIELSDQGPGIPPGKEEAIFDRFFTDRPNARDFGNHSGLGLAISRQIVEALGGTLRARNALDAKGKIIGAVFTIRLPSTKLGYKHIKKS